MLLWGTVCHHVKREASQLILSTLAGSGPSPDRLSCRPILERPNPAPDGCPDLGLPVTYPVDEVDEKGNENAGERAPLLKHGFEARSVSGPVSQQFLGVSCSALRSSHRSDPERSAPRQD